MSSKIRLIRIASEINISKDAIVEFLQSKGFSVENKPTAVLTGEMVDAVNSNFKKEIESREKQQKKLEKANVKTTSAKSKDIEEEDVEDVIVLEKSKILKKEINKEWQPTLIEDTENITTSDISTTTEEPTQKKEKDDIKKVEPTPEPQSENIQITEEPKETESPVLIATEKKDKIKVLSTIDLPEVGKVISIPNTDSTSSRFYETKSNKQDKSKKEQNTSKSQAKRKIKTEKDARVARNKEEIKKKVESEDKKIASTSIAITKKIKPAEDDAKLTKIKTQDRPKDKDRSIDRDKDRSIDKDRSTDRDKDKDRDRDKFIDSRNKSNYIKEINSVPREVLPIKKEFPTVPKTDDIDKVKKRVNEDFLEMPNFVKGLTVLGKIEVPTEHKFDREKEREKRKEDEKRNRSTTERNFRSRKDKNKGKGNDTSTYKDFRKRGEDGKTEFKRDDRKFNKDGERYTSQYSGDRHKDFKNRSGDFKGEFRKSGDKKFTERYVSPYAEPNKIVEKKVFSNNAPPKSSQSKADYDKKKKRKLTPVQDANFDVNKAIRSTLIDMEDTSNSLAIKKAKIKQKKKAVREEKEARLQEIMKQESQILRLTEFVTTSDLAALMNINANEIILKCMQLGLMVTINQRLDKDTIQLIADDYGYDVEFTEDIAVEDILEEVIDDELSLKYRPPIVTIMGHVDHGKTSLLDHIRNANVVAGEAGGITQHIGAYRVILKNKKSITFLDTPGHEAFTAMRARGAQVTDIVVIVVAADDSVMPQTIEAISHSRAANVPMVIAINKVDKPEANVDRIKQQLSDQGILVEDWGGTYQCAEISAKKGTNVDVLLDKILLEAEMLDLKANPDRTAQGIIIESRMTKGWGNIASVVIQKGTLFLQDNFVAGPHYGRVRALLDERGNKVQDVLPSQPVVVIGFDGLPGAGDTFTVVSSETEAREIASRRMVLRREQQLRQVHHITLDEISAQISIGGVKELHLIIKGDVAGSVEALSDSLLKLSTDEVKVNIIYKAAGPITESDVMLGAASKAIIIGFNNTTTPQSAKLAEQESVEIRRYNIIYDCINEVHLALEGMLKPDVHEEISGVVEVRQIFKISKIGQIAGCYVMTGKINRNDKIRILREGFPVFSGNIASLKRNKDDVREVEMKYECGIQIANFNAFEVGDIIEAVKLIEVKRTLEIKN